MDDLKYLNGFHMPGEFEPHKGCIMIWPVRPGSWPHGGVAAKRAFTQVAKAISDSEKVIFLADKEHLEEVKKYTSDIENIKILEIESDDAWARDVCPTFVNNGKNERIGIDWKFNAWGGEYDGLYKNWDRDDRVASELCRCLGEKCFDAHPFVLEGGSIHSDGEGTILTTKACLLSKGRNPELSKEQIEEKLMAILGARKVIWLPCGIFNDETNEHVDNICAFAEPGKVLLAWTDDVNDPQYEMSKTCEEVLLSERDAMGRKIEVVHLPIPKKPICVEEKDLEGYEFEEGEDVREPGERLAASYVNFYISNGGVVVPQFGDVNDALAVRILQECFKNRVIYPVAARDILLGGGNIHCITQQIPK